MYKISDVYTARKLQRDLKPGKGMQLHGYCCCDDRLQKGSEGMFSPAGSSVFPSTAQCRHQYRVLSFCRDLCAENLRTECLAIAAKRSGRCEQKVC